MRIGWLDGRGYGVNRWTLPLAGKSNDIVIETMLKEILLYVVCGEDDK